MKDVLQGDAQCPQLILALLTKIWIAGPGSRDPNHGVHDPWVPLGTMGSRRALFQELFSPLPTKTCFSCAACKDNNPIWEAGKAVSITLGSLHSQFRQH